MTGLAIEGQMKNEQHAQWHGVRETAWSWNDSSWHGQIPALKRKEKDRWILTVTQLCV
jgi:hypothetical protein